jgi:hypothetical protein
VKNQWLAAGALIVVGGLAGGLVAGWPGSTNDEIVADTGAVPSTTSTTAARATTASPRATTTTHATTTSTPKPTAMRPRKEVSVVVANAGFIEGVAHDTAGQLSALGYVAPQAQTAVDKTDRSVIYAAAGFDREATRLAQDLRLGGARRAQRKPDRPVTRVDTGAELIAVLGTDFPG